MVVMKAILVTLRQALRMAFRLPSRVPSRHVPLLLIANLSPFDGPQLL